MTLKKLPQDVQSILSASVQINTFRKAVEELVYNALDAESTSIAIRLHIQDSKIQVIDNGNGIQKHDFKALGQKHMTSKITDLSTLRSTPKTYGFRGETLASIVIVSQAVKIISRHKNEVEDTWVKTFHNGKEKRIAETSKRPSKGTTVEIKGFLYNLNIQKKSVDSLNELQYIKQYLEHISLAHSNISLSLRDDLNNEILFKIHKKRDIYQTLSSLFDIKENEIQELQVEKNNYKVRGLIGKAENECNRNWIYINGKFIYNNSKLHKIINDNFNRALPLKSQHKRDLKSKNHGDENHLFKKNLPCYFIFITCPYIDYTTSNTPKQSVLEFKNWEHIKNLLQKLVKFYVGDINLKEIRKPYNHAVLDNQENNIDKEGSTRDQVKKIINKILGSNSKKIGVSQLQKGIKGKLIKRNVSKKLNKKTPPKLLKKIFQQKDNQPITNNEDGPQDTEFKFCKDAYIKKKSTQKNKMITKLKTGLKEYKVKKKKTKNVSPCIPKTIEDKKNQIGLDSNKHNLSKNIPKRNETRNSISKRSNAKSGKYNLKDCEGASKNICSKFENKFESVEKRSRIIAEKAEKFLKNNVKNARHKQQTHSRNNDVVPLPPKINQNIIDKYIWMKMKKKTFKTTYDLVQTILRSQQELYADGKNNCDNFPFRDNDNCYAKLPSKYSNNIDIGSKLTFDSHCYYGNQGLPTGIGPIYTLNRDSNMRFITKQSRDNFIAPNEKLKSKLRNTLKQRRRVYDSNRMYDVCLKQTIEESVYTIEFSKSGSNNKECASRINSPLNKSNTYDIPENTKTNQYNGNNDYGNFPFGGNTYTISPSDFPYNNKFNTQFQTPAQNTKYKDDDNENIIILFDSTNKADRVENKNSSSSNSIERDTILCGKNRNIIFVSKSQSPNMELTYMRNVDPFNMCETILDSPDINKNELKDNFNANNKLNDSLFQNVTNQEIYLREAPPHTAPLTVMENVSHHFSNMNDIDQVENVNNEERVNTLQIAQELYEDIVPNITDNQNELDDNMTDNNNFNLKGRLRFLPKGMSQILAICNSKTACDYNLGEDYFEDSIYNNFANDVQANVETYEPIIQNVQEFTTANIQKVNDKLKKENASLIFDGISLKEANVLCQIDSKFIAAVVRQKSYQSEETKEYLVLFDQHAVHERIRLEKNLADYLSDDQWKSVSLDNITLNLSKDDVLYLHNYEDKFNQLGLQWTILENSEVSINAIPEAILGKNLREVENIIKAVRNLIKEEINIIKMQKGCVSLYPKSIMDLVFSEACRYAIKFGDTISKADCKELLQALSKCKTPFQCAHGRPVMAVLMEVGSVDREYKVDINKVKQFMLRRTWNP